MIENLMICYGAIKYVNAHTVYTMCLINKMKNIKSANVMSLCMLRRHYNNGTICACHIMILLIPGTFYNSPCWQACASMAVTQRSNALC